MTKIKKQKFLSRHCQGRQLFWLSRQDQSCRMITHRVLSILILCLLVDVWTGATAQAQTQIERPERAIVFLFDKSRSTRDGGYLDGEKRAILEITGHLQDGDWVSLIAFDNAPFQIVRPVRLSLESRRSITERLARIMAHSQSNPISSLETAVKNFETINAQKSLLVVMTDGKLMAEEGDLKAAIARLPTEVTLAVAIFSSDKKELEPWLTRADPRYSFVEGELVEFVERLVRQINSW